VKKPILFTLKLHIRSYTDVPSRYTTKDKHNKHNIMFINADVLRREILLLLVAILAAILDFLESDHDTIALTFLAPHAFL